jgi:peptidyl-prolyl cis-trans isomerase A (cyclophilin A)
MFARFTFIILVLSGLQAKAQEPVRCLVETALGNMTIELYPDKAPVTVKNFLYYTDNHLYDSTSFYRVCTPANEANREVKIEVIQGGDIADNKLLAPIAIETTAQTGLKHVDGTISMARLGPNTATCNFFICIGNQPALDFGGARNPDGQGFAAFGQVISGMEVVKKIQKQEDKQQYLVHPVIIYRLSRL